MLSERDVIRLYQTLPIECQFGLERDLDHARMRAIGQRFEVRHSNLPAPWEVYDLLLSRPTPGAFYTRAEAECARRIWEVEYRALYREHLTRVGKWWDEYRRQNPTAHCVQGSISAIATFRAKETESNADRTGPEGDR